MKKFFYEEKNVAMRKTLGLQELFVMVFEIIFNV